MMLDITCLGDSITVGATGSSIGHGYRGPLYWGLVGRGAQVRLRGSVVSDPASVDAAGDLPWPCNCHEGHSSQGIQYLIDNIAAFKTAAGLPAVWIVLIGTNDSNVDADANAYSGRMNTLIDALPGRIVWCKIPPQDPAHGNDTRIATINNCMQGNIDTKVGNGRQITLVDLNSLLSYATELFDGTHPNDKGYAKIGDKLATALAGP